MLTLTSDYVVELILPPPPQIVYVHLLLDIWGKHILERDRYDPSECGLCKPILKKQWLFENL